MTGEKINLEMAIIGALMTFGDNPKVSSQIPELSPDDFSTEFMHNLCKRAKDLFAEGKPVDGITVAEGLTVTERELLKPLIQAAVFPENFGYYVELLKQRSKLQQLKDQATTISIAEKLEDVNEPIAKLNLLTAGSNRWSPQNIAEALDGFCERHKSTERPPFLDFGFKRLNKRLYLEKGDFIVIGGEPSSGKTALALQMADYLSDKNKVGFFSLETSVDKLMDRLIAQTAAVPLHKIKNNDLGEVEWSAIMSAADDIYTQNIELISAAGMTAADIQAYAVANRYDVIIVDYLQIIKGDNERQSRYETVTQTSLALHTLAQANNIAVIALAQLSRPEKGKKTPPPSMSDLRESGQIEQDADAVMILYLEDRKNPKGARILKVDKNKEGERGNIRLDFDGGIQRFTETEEVVIYSKTATHTADGKKITKPGHSVEELRKFEQVTFEEEELF